MTSIRQVAKRVLPRPVVDWLRAHMNRAQSPGVPTRRLSLPERGPGVDHMAELEERMWSTGEQRDVDELERAVRRTGHRSRGRVRGSLALARRDFHFGETEAAMERLAGLQCSDPDLQSELDLFRVDCLCHLRDGQAALRVLSRMTGRHTRDQNLLLRVGHVRSLLSHPKGHGSGPMTEVLNGLYAEAGFGMIRRTDVSASVGLDNLSCDVLVADPAESQPLVTVVVVTTDSIAGRHAGIDCVLHQSWRNMEILVVGGVSSLRRLTDIEPTLVEDDRVEMVEEEGDIDHLTRIGLTHATGDLTTTHSYGSWSHPQRVEAQATALMADAGTTACISSHIKVGADLSPRPLGAAPSLHLVGPGPDSMMIRSSTITGGEVSDSYQRLIAGLSPHSGGLKSVDDVTHIGEGVPLTLTLHDLGAATTSTGGPR